MIDVSGMVFPQDIAALHGQATEALAKKDKQVELLLVEDEGCIRLATVKEASTGTTLFYPPVYPLWKCMKNGQRKQATNLLLSVFAYLHRNVGRSEEHTSERQSLMRISYAVFCLTKQTS